MKRKKILEWLRLLGLEFVTITLAILAITGIYAGVTDTALPSYVILASFGIGFLAALPSLLFVIPDDKTFVSILIHVAHFLLVGAIVMTCGYFIGWFESVFDIAIDVISFLVIYGLVWLAIYVSNRSKAKSINAALKKEREEKKHDSE